VVDDISEAVAAPPFRRRPRIHLDIVAPRATDADRSDSPGLPAPPLQPLQSVRPFLPVPSLQPFQPFLPLRPFLPLPPALPLPPNHSIHHAHELDRLVPARVHQPEGLGVGQRTPVLEDRPPRPPPDSLRA